MLHLYCKVTIILRKIKKLKNNNCETERRVLIGKKLIEIYDIAATV